MSLGKIGIKASAIGFVVNFILFLIKLYVGISSNSLSIYCDCINNLGDTLSCLIALGGFYLVNKYSERKGIMTQSLFSFVIGIIVALSGLYFAYAGIQRMLYPTPVSYSVRYAVLIFITILVKLAVGFALLKINKKYPSDVIKALMIDSFMDSAVTLTVLLGFGFTQKINFALDGLISIVVGILVSACAAKTVVKNAGFIINS